MPHDRQDSYAAFSSLFADLVVSIMEYADSPTRCCEFITGKIRELIGVRTVLILQCDNHISSDTHRLLAAFPQRRADMARQPEIESLCRLSHGLTQAAIIGPNAPSPAGSEIVAAIGLGNCVVLPLRYSGNRIGVMLLLDVMDLKGIDTVIETLDRLGPVLALILRNATLYSGMEQEVAERTRALSEANALLAQKDALLQAMLRNLPFDFWARDSDQRMLLQSDESVRLWGDLQGQAVDFADVSPQILEHWKSVNQKVLAGQVVSEEKSYLNRDGGLRHYRAIVAPIRQEESIRGMLGINLDITELRRTQEALERRILALTAPLESSAAISFDALFSLEDIQRIQDEFSAATGVASIITRLDGAPITAPSNFCRLCRDIIRQTSKGLANCQRSDAVIGRPDPNGATVKRCLSGGLWDAGAAIVVGGHHIANWLIGQVRDETQTEEGMRAYAREIGADEEAVVQAFREVPSMSRSHFDKIGRALHTLARQLSTSAYQNIQQARTIHERKLSEEKLQKSESQLALAMSMAKLGHWEMDVASGMFTFSDSFYAIFRTSAAQMGGYSMSVEDYARRFVHPDDRHQVALETQKALEAQSADYSAYVEHRILYADGESGHIGVRISLIKDGQGQTIKTYGVNQDITERKLAEEALAMSETRFRLLFDEIPAVAVQGYDQNRTVVYWNEASTKYYGYTRQEAIGRKLEDLIIPVPMRLDVVECIRAWVEDNVPIPAGELTLMRKDGSPIHVYSSHVLQRLNDGTSIMYCLDLDLTELSAARSEMVRAKENAEAANRSKSLFLANMSHELRTPLNGLLGMLHILKGDATDPATAQYTEMALRAGRRLTSLLGDILDLSRIEAGRMPIGTKPFPLRDLLTALTETFSPIRMEKNLSFAIDLAPGLPQLLVGDEVRVRQILFNLVGNALKFTEQGEVRVHISMLAPLPDGRARVLFVVSDTGMGIPDSKVDQVCNPFTQVAETFTRSQQGAGLGLSIARHLVQLMDGTMTFETGESLGTSVYLMLPFGVAAALPMENAVREGAHNLGALRILLVEDEEISRLSAQLTLAKLGHDVNTAENGFRALKALRAGRYDCVLMDIQMDGMDGMEATRRIRSGEAGAENARIPIIAMTAYAMEGDRERFLDAGMDEHIPKPFSVEALNAVLGTVDRFKGASGG